MDIDPFTDPSAPARADEAQTADSLAGKLLIAMPGMRDPRFAHSVVLICMHGGEGAMGLVLNRPLPEIRFGDLMGQLGIEARPARDLPVHFGGPVEPGRGFVLHSLDSEDNGADEPEGRVRLAGGAVGLTATRDILEEIARGEGPHRAVLTLGYASWAPGQLESEMLANGWLTAEAGEEILFGAGNTEKWLAALRTLGIDPLTLSATAGRA